MSIKRLLANFAAVFAVALIATGIVTLLWNLIARGTMTIDWETSVRFAIVFGIVFSWMETRRSGQK